MRQIGVVGAGAWGTALAHVAARAGREVIIRARDGDLAATIMRRHENPVYLPGVALDRRIRATSRLADLAGVDAILLAPPAQHLREIAGRLARHAGDKTPVVICSKGIEHDSGAFMSAVVEEVWPTALVGVLSGPSFAADVARGHPTAVTLAGEADLCRQLVRALGRRVFRPYLSDDIIGVQVGGALKNVMAIACGIVAGRGLGESAGAALVARGFAELMRFGTAAGAKPATLTGLSGLGDLVLTCCSRRSRNMSLGVALGEGRSVEEVTGSRRQVSEGVATASAVVQVAAGLGVDMPIAAAVAAVVTGRMDVDEAVESLLARPFRAES